MDTAVDSGAGYRTAAPLARRQWVMVAVLLTAAGVAGLGLASPWWIKSPQQIAAETAAPSPSVLTATVEQRVVNRTVVLRGTVTSQQVFEKTPSSGPDGGPSVVTGVRVAVGDEVAVGEVVLEVSGRPLIALLGEIPAYRDLRPGAEGEDVAQLQRALDSLGYGPPQADGRFGAATKQAVEAFYDDRGYPVPTTGEADEAAVAAAESEVTQLEWLVEDARDAVENATTPEELERAGKELDRAATRLSDAQERLAALRNRTGPMLPLSELVFLPSFPARVHSLNAQIGAPLEAPLVGLASGPLVVEAQASSAQGELLQLGLAAEVTPDGGEAVGGVVGSMEEADGSAGAGRIIAIIPDAPLDPTLAGRGARVVLEATSSGDEVLAVPVSGLFAAADGTVYVVRLTSYGEDLVTVAPGVSGDGYVAVTPVDGELLPGDVIVVGSRSVPAALSDGR